MHTPSRAPAWSTIFSLIGEFFKSGPNMLFWFAFLIDLLVNLEVDTPLGASKKSLIAAAFLSSFVTAGLMYCHFKLNLQNQSSDALIVRPRTGTGFGVPDVPSTNTHILQKLALIGDRIGHIGGIASVQSYLVMLLGLFGTLPSRSIRIGLNVGTFILGTLCSRGDAHTCHTNLLKANSEYYADAAPDSFDIFCVGRDTKNDRPTFATIFSIVAEVLQNAPSNAFWFAFLTDLLFNLEVANPLLGASEKSLIAGGVFALYVSACAAYCHYILNLSNQASSTSLAEGPLAELLIETPARNIFDSSRTTSSGLTLWQVAALAGDMLSHMLEISAAQSLILVIIGASWPRSLRIGLNVASLALSVLFSMGEVQTCRTTIYDYNVRTAARMPNRYAWLFGSVWCVRPTSKPRNVTDSTL
jgi:hypothetical protein